MPGIAKFCVVFATIGAVVAVALLAYDHWFLVSPAGYNTATDSDLFLFLALCPPSLGLMALENARGAALMAGMLGIVVLNAALYGGVGILIWCVTRCVANVVSWVNAKAR
jgi:hypothetical protein